VTRIQKAGFFGTRPGWEKKEKYKEGVKVCLGVGVGKWGKKRILAKKLQMGARGKLYRGVKQVGSGRVDEGPNKTRGGEGRKKDSCKARRIISGRVTKGGGGRALLQRVKTKARTEKNGCVEEREKKKTL